MLPAMCLFQVHAKMSRIWSCVLQPLHMLANTVLLLYVNTTSTNLLNLTADFNGKSLLNISNMYQPVYGSLKLG